MEWFEPYWDRLCAMLGLHDRLLYEYGEGWGEPTELTLEDNICGYGGCECMYLPEDLSWAIYFSHENTVTFAGTILPRVRELLADEREHWNKWD